MEQGNFLENPGKEEKDDDDDGDLIETLLEVRNLASKSGYSRSQQDCHEKHLKRLHKEFTEFWRRRLYSDIQISDFEKIKVIGTGAFGVVYLVKYIPKNKYYAMKMLQKAKLVKLKQIKNSYYEKKVLCSLDFPFCVFMKYFFKDNVYLYFVLPYIAGGELFSYLRKKGKLEEQTSKFYASQVVLALEYLHYCELIYRDLKPENILIDKTGYIKITDFGFAKILNGRTWTLCGTPEYIAPEVLQNSGYGYSADWWSFGVLIYDMSAGYPPFYALSHEQLYEKIISGVYKIPKHFSDSLTDLISNTIVRDKTKRFGELKDGVLDFKNHAWFAEIIWDDILNLKTDAPYIPNIKSRGDPSNFDDYETQRINSSPTNLYENEFFDF